MSTPKLLLTRRAASHILVSKRLTGLLAFSELTSSDWVAISLVYIGVEGMADIAARWKHG